MKMWQLLVMSMERHVFNSSLDGINVNLFILQLAWKMGRYRTAQTWKIIAMFYSDELAETDPEESIHESVSVSHSIAYVIEL